MNWFSYKIYQTKRAWSILMEIIIAKFFFLNWNFSARSYRKKKNFNEKPRLMFGPIGLSNNMYWSNILSKSGYYSKTVVFEAFNINKKEDFDIYFADIIAQNYKMFLKFI